MQKYENNYELVGGSQSVEQRACNPEATLFEPNYSQQIKNQKQFVLIKVLLESFSSKLR